MNKTYIQKGTDAKRDMLAVYNITTKHIPDIQLELKEIFKRDWAEKQGDQEYLPATAMFKAYETDLEFVCMDTLKSAGATIKTFLAYLQGSEFNIFSEYNNRGMRCRYVKYDSKAFYREDKDVVVFSVTVKINNPLSYSVKPSYSVIRTADWSGISVNPTTGDVYGCIMSGDIYKQTAGNGIWVAQNATGQNRAWNGISTATNGDVYACVTSGDIYKKASGTSNWVAQNATGTVRTWWGVSVNSTTGDVYGCVGFSGDIYKQTAGSGDWIAQNATGVNRSWTGISVRSNGDVYACTSGTDLGEIYKQTAGAGDWVLENSTGQGKTWNGISVANNGDAYACTHAYGGDIYKKALGSSNWISQNVTGTFRGWWGVSVNSVNGDVYSCENEGDIYRQITGSGNWIAQNAVGTISTTVFSISFTTNSPTVIYWDDGTSNTYEANISVNKTFTEDGHFAIIAPSKL